jgi:hypothetical protein
MPWRSQTLSGSVLLGALMAAGCVEPVPPRDPADYLRVGVDPREEAAHLARAFEDDGYRVRRLVNADRVAMLDAVGPEGQSALRVVTHVGVALGIDVPDRGFPTRERVRGLPAPLSGGDLDGDGAIELLIAVVDRTRMGECIAVVRVDEHGQVSEVFVDTSPVQEHACAERAENVAGDARAELLVVGRYLIPPLNVPASVAVPFTGFEGRYVPMGPEAARYFAGERSVRLERLMDARRAREADTISRLAVELGVLRFFEWGDAERAILALDEESEGAHVDALAAGRALIRALAEAPGGRAAQDETE